jgi:hypothetical protein
VIRHKLSITWEQLVLPGTCLGVWLLLGTTLHGYGESLFNKWECRRLTWPRHALWRIYTRADIKICVGENRASSILSRA